MTQAGKTFRIFVSSTFNDLKEERNALQRYVFPRLRDLCMQHGCRFQAIDLRWGVSEEAARDQQTMKICLEEIARCQKTTPRPNFIVLLGDRYGWCPLPAEIPEDEFEQIKAKITDVEDGKLIAHWYRYDENAVPPANCLRERVVDVAEDATEEKKKAAQEKEFEEWRIIEKKLRSIHLSAIDQLGWQKTDLKRVKYEASATEQEINQGALKPSDAQKHVFCFFRTIDGLPEDISAKDFLDIDNNGNLDKTAQSQLSNLKERLEVQLSGNVLKYKAKWTDKDYQKDHIGSLPEKLEDCLKLNDADTIHSGLCADVWRKLSKVILEEIAQFKDVDALEKEIENHNDFGKDRVRFFVGRDTILQKISDYVKGKDKHPLAVFGVSGSGKSALMARAVEQARSKHQNAMVIVRFIGATPESSDGRALLESLCHHIARSYGADESTVPSDYEKLVEDFPKRLVLATSVKPLFIFLDALDQFSSTDNANNLIWIPRELPDNVHLVVSTLQGEEKKLSSVIQIPLEKMLYGEGKKLLYKWLNDTHRKLQENQEKEVLNKFEKNGLPLYLKLAFEETRRWRSYDGIPASSNGEQGLSEDIHGIIQGMFRRLSRESNHGRMLVACSMGYLAASRNGLSEDEILDVLSRDVWLYQDFLKRSHHTPPENRLPVVIWSRLYFDLKPYLTERSEEGIYLLAFFHRQFREVVFEEYLATEILVQSAHLSLANYFKSYKLGPRKINELPWQLAQAKYWNDLVILLADLHFLKEAWRSNRYDILEYWQKIESQSQFTKAKTYNRVLKMPNLYIEFLFTIAEIFQSTSSFKEAVKITKFQVEYYRNIHDKMNLARSLIIYAELLKTGEDYESAMQFYKEAVRIFHHLKDNYGLLRAMDGQAIVLMNLADLDGALTIQKEIEQLCIESKNKKALQLCLGHQADILFFQNNVKDALLLLKEKENICRELGDEDGLLVALNSQGMMLRELGKPKEALILLKDGENICRKLGKRDALRSNLRNQWLIMKNLGYDGAEALYEQSENLRNELYKESILPLQGHNLLGMFILKIACFFILYTFQFSLLISLIFNIWNGYFAFLDKGIVKIVFASYLALIDYSIKNLSKFRGRAFTATLTTDSFVWEEREMLRRHNLSHSYTHQNNRLANMFRIEAYMFFLWGMVELLEIVPGGLYFGNKGRVLLFILLITPFIITGTDFNITKYEIEKEVKKWD